MKARSLQDLQVIAQHLAQARERQAAEKAARQQLEQRLLAEKNLFVRAAGAVKPLAAHGRVRLQHAQPEPLAIQQQLDEQRVLCESLSDEFDAGTLLEVDETLSFRRPGVGIDVTRKLRRGDWTIQREVDLHGLRREAARETLSTFIRESHRQGLRCVRVIHGKGLGSPGKAPVLKGKVHSWLVQKAEVMAFVQARPAQGGAGALVVLLRPAGRG